MFEMKQWHLCSLRYVSASCPNIYFSLELVLNPLLQTTPMRSADRIN